MFKQVSENVRLFCIPQRYDFSSKSQLRILSWMTLTRCFVYRKGTIFQANHNALKTAEETSGVVLYTAKVRFFKQITTHGSSVPAIVRCFVYRKGTIFQANHNCSCPACCRDAGCFVYRKGTIFQANHNTVRLNLKLIQVVLYTAKVRFFKQITTYGNTIEGGYQLFCIPQRYDFSSKSQQGESSNSLNLVVLYTAKVRFFKQITTVELSVMYFLMLFCIPQRYDFSSKSQQSKAAILKIISCFVYRKGTIFQANHNNGKTYQSYTIVVLYTAKVRFFKQITTNTLFEAVS